MNICWIGCSFPSLCRCLECFLCLFKSLSSKPKVTSLSGGWTITFSLFVTAPTLSVCPSIVTQSMWSCILVYVLIETAPSDPFFKKEYSYIWMFVLHLYLFLFCIFSSITSQISGHLRITCGLVKRADSLIYHRRTYKETLYIRYCTI